jgi:hypothetical protein
VNIHLSEDPAMRHTSTTILAGLLFLPALADEPPADKAGAKPPTIAPPTEKDLADERMQFMKKALSRFTIHVGEQKEPATVGDPCLHWTNPIGGAPDGIIAVYARNRGRPAAIGQFFFNKEQHWVNEFTIIAESDVTIQRSDREFWKPPEYSCKFTDLPRSPQPGDKPVARLAQMRAIAADFSVIDYFRGTKQALRLLPQPVYRYSEKGKILDGALFIFALGTDPECCVLVEAYQDKDGSRYRYAVAPMSVFRLETRYKDRLVWPVGGDPRRSYFVGIYQPEPGEALPMPK